MKLNFINDHPITKDGEFMGALQILTFSKHIEKEFLLQNIPHTEVNFDKYVDSIWEIELIDDSNNVVAKYWIQELRVDGTLRVFTNPRNKESNSDFLYLLFHNYM